MVVMSIKNVAHSDLVAVHKYGNPNKTEWRTNTVLKAAGLDGLTAEHLQHCHPALISILNKFFNLLIKFNYVPKGFGTSYTVPLPKNSYSVASKSLSVEDFRGISISAVISKVFEKCILDRYQRFFETSDSIANLALKKV